MQDSTPIADMKPPVETGVPDMKEPTPIEDLNKMLGITDTDNPSAPVETVVDTLIEEPQVIDTPIEVSTEVPTQVVDTPTTISYTQEQVNSMVEEQVNTRLADELKKFESINTFFEEYQKDPYSYIAKYSPHLFEKFNELDYVKSKLTEEYGDFKPDPSRVYELGTQDYSYVMRQNELINEAKSLKSQAQQTITGQQQSREQAESDYIATKAKELGMDIPTFNSNVWSKLNAMNNQSVLDTLVDAIILKEKLAEHKTNIKQQVDLTKVAPSPAIQSGTGRPTMDKEMAMLKSMFGSQFD